MLPEHKNPIFVLERPENGGSEGQKRTKTPILCSAKHGTARSATPRLGKQKRRQPFGLSPLKIGGYLLSHMVVQYHRRK